jgi:type IV secretory pathway component VirB8
MSKKSKTDQYIENANNWESSMVAQQNDRVKSAVRNMYIAFGLVFILTVAIIVMLPLKERVPYLIRENSTSGAIDVVGKLEGANVEYSEVRDKYWLAQYVQQRETYDWFILNRDYHATLLLSDAPVAQAYASQYGGENGLDKNKDAVKISVKILSIVLSKSGGATIRFEKHYNGSLGSTQIWVATVNYKYDSNIKSTEQDRLINPFGFLVTSYRVDQEMNSSPSPVQSAQAQSVAQPYTVTPPMPTPYAPRVQPVVQGR